MGPAPRGTVERAVAPEDRVDGRTEESVQIVLGMEVFVRVAELRSFARAAKALELTPSGVGKIISRLEAELGVRLFHRTTRHVGLTDEGAVFIEHCRRVLEDVEIARESLSGRDAAPRGRLRLSVPRALGRLVLVPALPGFTARHPEVSLDVSFSDRKVNLVEEGIDLAVRVGELHDSSLVARRIGGNQLVTLAAPSLLASRPIETLGDLALAPCVAFRGVTTGRERPWDFRVEGRPLVWHPRASVLFDDGEAMVAGAAAGLGVTQVPSYMADEALRAGALVEILVTSRPAPLPIQVIYPSQRNLPARTRAFVEFLVGLRDWGQGRPVPRGRRPGKRPAAQRALAAGTAPGGVATRG